MGGEEEESDMVSGVECGLIVCLLVLGSYLLMRCLLSWIFFFFVTTGPEQCEEAMLTCRLRHSQLRLN